MRRFFTKKIIIITVIVLAVIAGIVLKVSNGGSKQKVTVVRADLKEVVSATGKVKPFESVDLGFDKSGRIRSVNAEVGSEVKKGDVLAAIDAGDTEADLAKARALLNQETLKLADLKGTAPITYNDALKNLDAAVKNAFASSDDAIRNKADQFFKNTVQNPQFEVSIISGNYVNYFDVPSDAKLEINSERKRIEALLVEWQMNLSNSSDVVRKSDLALSDLRIISTFLDKMASAINNFVPGEFTYEATVNSYKSTIASARSEVLDAISSVVTAKDKLNEAPSLSSGGEFGTVSIQEAKVREAQHKRGQDGQRHEHAEQE